MNLFNDVLQDRPPWVPRSQARPQGGICKTDTVVDAKVVARYDKIDPSIYDRKCMKFQRSQSKRGVSDHTSRDRRSLASTLFCVAMVMQYMIGAVQASIFDSTQDMYERIGGDTCVTDGLIFDISVNIVTGDKMVAVAGMTSSNAVLSNNDSNTGCKSQMLPFVRWTKDGQFQDRKKGIISSTSLESLQGAFTSIIALKFPTFLQLNSMQSATNTAMLASVWRFAKDGDGEQYGQSDIRIYELSTGNLIMRKTIPFAVYSNPLNQYFEFFVQSPNPTEVNYNLVNTHMITGHDLTVAFGGFPPPSHSFMWQSNRLESTRYSSYKNLCAFKTQLTDADHGTFLGGHIALLDSTGASTGHFVPLIVRTDMTGRPDIAQIITPQTNDPPYYSIDILQPIVNAGKVVGLAVPRTSLDSLDNSGKMMVVMMNAQAEYFKLFVVGFLATSNSELGLLYRKPFGIFDNSDKLSFVFVSSSMNRKDADIKDIKGPDVQWMEIYSIYQDFQDDSGELQGMTGNVGSWEVIPQYQDPPIDAITGFEHFPFGLQCQDAGHPNEGDSHFCEVRSFFRPRCQPYEASTCYFAYLSTTNFKSPYVEPPSDDNFRRLVSFSQHSTTDSLKMWYDEGQFPSDLDINELIEYQANAATVKSAQYLTSDLSQSISDNKKIWDYKAIFTPVDQLADNVNDRILGNSMRSCFKTSCEPVSFADPESITPQSFTLSKGGNGQQIYEFSTFSQTHLNSATLTDIYSVDVFVEGGPLPSFITFDPNTYDITLNDPASDFDASSWINKAVKVKVKGICVGTGVHSDDYCNYNGDFFPQVVFEFQVCAHECCSATFSNTDIHSSFQTRSNGPFESSLFVTNPTGCTVTYQISSDAYEVQPVDSRLDPNVEIDGNFNLFKIHPTSQGHILEITFYIFATISGSGAQHVSNQVTFRYGCGKNWTNVTKDGSFVDTVGRQAGTTTPYQIQGLSLDNPGCEIVEMFINTFNTVQTNPSQHSTFQLADSCSSNDNTCNSRKIVVPCPSTNTYYIQVAIIRTGGNGSQKQILGPSITVTTSNACQHALFDQTTISQPTQSDPSKWSTAKFTTTDASCQVEYSIWTDTTATASPTDTTLDTSGSTIDVTTTMSAPYSITFYIKAQILPLCSGSAVLWSSALQYSGGCGPFSKLVIDSTLFNSTVTMLPSSQSSMEFPYNIKGLSLPTTCGPPKQIKAFFISSSSTSRTSVTSPSTVLEDQFYSKCTEDSSIACDKWLINTDQGFEFYIGAVVGEGSSTTNDFDIYSPTPVTVEIVPSSNCGEAFFDDNPQIFNNNPSSYNGMVGQYSNSFWSAFKLKANPFGCPIKYEISTTTDSLIDPANLNPNVDYTSSTNSFNITYLDSTLVAQTNFYIRATIIDSGILWWSSQQKYFQGCSDQWSKIQVANSGFINTATVTAGQTGTYTINTWKLYVRYPKIGCEPTAYEVSGSSSSITAITGGTVTKQSGCVDPCLNWDINTVVASSSSSFSFYFVFTIPGNIKLFPDADTQKITVTVNGVGCSSATFASNTISSETQYHMTYFESEKFTTIPPDCAITYEISDTHGSISAPAKLSPTVGTSSDGQKFKITATSGGDSFFYLRATIDGSSTPPFWSNQLNLHHKCTPTGYELSQSNTFVTTLSGNVGQNIAYVVDGLSIDKRPSDCANSETITYHIKPYSTSHANFDPNVLTVSAIYGSSTLNWELKTLDAKTIQFYVLMIITQNSDSSTSFLFSSAVSLTTTPGPCASYLTINGLSPFQSRQSTTVNINTVERTGIVPQWLQGENLVIPLSSYASTNGTDSPCDTIQMLVAITSNQQTVVVNTDLNGPVNQLSIAMPQNSNKTLEFDVTVIHGNLEVDRFSVVINFNFICNPSLIDYSRLPLLTTGNLLTNATKGGNNTIFRDGNETLGSNTYPYIQYSPGTYVKYNHSAKCPIGFKFQGSGSGPPPEFRQIGLTKYFQSIQAADQYFRVLRPNVNVSASMTLETHYLDYLGGFKVDEKEITFNMFKNCLTSQGLIYNQTLNTSYLCYVHDNCTVGQGITVDLSNSLSMVEDCPEIKLSAKFQVSASNYTKGMQDTFKLTDNNLTVTTPWLNDTQRLSVEIIAVTDQGTTFNSGQFLQFDFMAGLNAAPQFKNILVMNYDKEGKASLIPFKQENGGPIVTEIAVSYSQQVHGSTEELWVGVPIFIANVTDDEGDIFILEFEDQSQYENLIRVFKTDTYAELYVNRNKITTQTRKVLFFKLSLKDKYTTLRNDYQIELKVDYDYNKEEYEESLKENKPLITVTIDEDENENDESIANSTSNSTANSSIEEEKLDDEEKNLEEDEENETAIDKMEEEESLQDEFLFNNTALGLEEGEEVDEEALKVAIEEKKKNKLKDEVLSIIDLDVEEEDLPDPIKGERESQEKVGQEDEQDEEALKKERAKNREKEQKKQAVELIDQMDSSELEDLKLFLKEKKSEEPEPVGEDWEEEEEEEPEEQKSDIVEIVEKIIPSKPPGFKEVNPVLLFAIEKDMERESKKKQEALQEKRKKVLEETGIEPDPPKAVKMKIGGISKDGKMGLGFNQPLAVPTLTDKKGRRRMAGADQIDMSKVLGIKMEPKSDVEAQKLKYYIEVVEWTEDKLDVQVKFKDADKLSQGETNDQIQIEIKNPGYFASKDSGVVADPKDQRPDDAQNSVPEQLPEGMSEEEIAKSAAQGKNTGLTVVILQLVAQLFLKTGMDKLWALFFTLQLVQSITIYNQSIPPVSQVWVEQIRSLVNFEMLKPDPMLQLYDRDLSVKYIMEKLKNEIKKKKEVMTKNFDSSGIESTDIVVNMSTIILIVAAAIVLLMVVVVFAVILPSKKLRDKVKQNLIKAKDGFFWNGFIRSQSISYLTLCISLTALYKDMMSKPELNMGQLGTFLVIFSFLVLYPLIILIYLKCQKVDELVKEEKQAKIGNLIKNLKLKRNKYTKYYYPVFMTRRLVFVMIVMFIPHDKCIQMQALIFYSSAYIIWYTGVRAHLDMLERYLEVFNEVVTQIIFYHLMIFSDFYVGQNRYSIKLYASYSFVVFLGLLILVNLLYVLVQMFWQIKKWLRIRQNKSNAQKQKEMHEKLIAQKKKKVDDLHAKIVSPEEQEKQRLKRLEKENRQFEKALSAQIDKYEEKHGRLKSDVQTSQSESESEESITSSRERSQLKQKLSKKVQKTRAKMRAGGKRNAGAAENMETIQENSIDDDSIELTQNNGSNENIGPKRLEESSDEMLSNATEQEEQCRLELMKEQPSKSNDIESNLEEIIKVEPKNPIRPARLPPLKPRGNGLNQFLAQELKKKAALKLKKKSKKNL